MATVADIALHKFTQNCKLLLDTNIWYDIYGPQGNPHDARVKTYSTALKRILNAESELYTNALVLSEFANRYARFDWQRQPQEIRHETFKQYRESNDFLELAPTLALLLRRIIEDCVVIESGLVGADVSAIFDAFATGKHDFNDLLIADVCATNDLTLVTHDLGFYDRSIAVLTANARLLATPL